MSQVTLLVITLKLFIQIILPLRYLIMDQWHLLWANSKPVSHLLVTIKRPKEFPNHLALRWDMIEGLLHREVPKESTETYFEVKDFKNWTARRNQVSESALGSGSVKWIYLKVIGRHHGAGQFPHAYYLVQLPFSWKPWETRLPMCHTRRDLVKNSIRGIAREAYVSTVCD